MADEVLSLRALNRALLARQLLLDRPELPAGDASSRRALVVRTIEQLVGLQAQAPFPPYYGLWSRLGGFRPDDLALLLTDRSVVRIALMRGTIHLVSARDCLPLRRMLQPVLDRGLRGSFGKQLAGVDAGAVAAAGRSRMVSAENLKRFYTINGVFPGSVLIDGFVAGMWRLARHKNAATLSIELFGRPRERAQLTGEAERMLAFCAPGADHDIRFAPVA